MRFAVELHIEKFPALLSDFIAITGWNAWARRRKELERQLRENYLLADLFRERHRLELALFNFASRRRRLAPPKLFRNSFEYEIAAFMAITVAFYQRLDRTAKENLAGRLRDGLKSDTALNALYHEMTAAGHFLRQGFDVDPSDLRLGGGFDFLITNEAIEAEVECKLATSDIGRRIHRRHMLDLLQVIEPRLKALPHELTGGYVLRVIVRGSLSANIVLLRSIADTVSLVLREKQSATRAEFDVLSQPFDSVKVSPRLCRGTHPGLTYTTVAYESPISTKRRRFVHERVPEPEPYPMGL